MGDRHARSFGVRKGPLAVAIALPLVAVAFVASAVERPFAPVQRHGGASRRAAVAIRDDVIPFQKWGTRAFTRPYLEKAYDRVDYFTQTSADDRRADFVRAIADAAADCDSVDVFLLAHGNRFVGWVSALDPATTAKIRLVYDTGCGDVSQSARWMGLGVKAYVGHVGLSASPVFYVFFLRRWSAGWPLDEAVDSANAEAARVLQITRLGGLSTEEVADMVEGSRAVLVGRRDLRLEAS